MEDDWQFDLDEVILPPRIPERSRPPPREACTEVTWATRVRREAHVGLPTEPLTKCI